MPRTEPAIAPARDGMVLLLALLCILALEVTAVSMHFITVQELRTARSATRDLELRLAARSAVSRALHAWPAQALADLPVDTSMSLPAASIESADGVSASASIRRVAPDAYLAIGVAQSMFGEVHRVGAVVVVASPALIAASITYAVRITGAITMNPGALINGVIDTAVAGSDAVGTMDVRRLVEIARSAHDSSASPLAYLPAGSAVPVAITHGVIIVDGDAAMDGGSFAGILVVRGTLTLTGGASISGAVIVDGGDLLVQSATISHDAAAILAAVSNPLLLGPYRPRGRMWIPLF